MKCPFCGNFKNAVLDTRINKDGDSIRRRRQCTKCESRFTTVESHVLNLPFVVKKDGRREPFCRDKIAKGVQLACQKRPISQARIENTVDRVGRWAMSRAEKEISTHLLGRKVMVELKQLDDVAYVRFASVYRTFRDLQEFVETLDADLDSHDETQLILTAPASHS